MSRYKSHVVSAVDPAAQGVLEDLDRRMAAFYNSNAMTQYYAHAEAANVSWSEDCGQALIRKLASPGSRVVDFGCGSAHALRHLNDTGAAYTGCDVSAKQIHANQQEFGAAAQFITSSLYGTPFPDCVFDLAFSTYVLEHLVWPHRCLAEMVRVVKPGGFIVLVCPHFRPRNRIPSLFYGSYNAPIRDRLRQHDYLGVIRHLWLRQVHYPSLLRRNYPPQTRPFLINVSPSCLDGDYYPDNDAVYFTYTPEITAFLASLGASDVTDHYMTMHRISRRQETVVVVAQKRLEQ